jgi:hypothetical protein
MGKRQAQSAGSTGNERILHFLPLRNPLLLRAFPDSVRQDGAGCNLVLHLPVKLM